MRYSKEHKEQIRQKLLSASGSHAKKHGFAASGVDALAGSAGVTIGSLYKHFNNKDALFAELIRSEIKGTDKLFAQLAQGGPEALIKALAAYVSLAHVQSPETGCPLPTLTAEVARAPDEVRAAFESGLLELKDTLARLTGSADVAWSLIAQSVGAVMIARAMHSEAAKKGLLKAVRTTGTELIKQATGDAAQAKDPS